MLLLTTVALASAPGPVTASLDARASVREIQGVPADVAQTIWQIELLRLAPVSLAGFAADPDPLVRGRTADALGRLRTADALPLLTTLLSDGVIDVRARAAFALGQTPGGHVPLTRRWGQETEVDVLSRIATALGKQGGPETTDMLIPALDGPVSLAAADGLGRLGVRKIANATSDRAVAALLEAAAFPVGDMRRRAAWALSRLGLTTTSSDNAMRLRDLALQDGDALVRAWTLRAWLGVATEAARLDGLTIAAADAATGVRIAAARGAAKHDAPGLTPILNRLLGDAELDVRLEAITAVATAPAVDAGAMLAKSLGSSIAVERAAAVRSLAKKKALPEAITRYNEASEPLAVRVAAVEAMDDRNRLLFLALRAPEAPIRSAAAGVLLEGDTPRTSELLELLKGDDLVIAEAAAQTLVEHPDPTAEAALLAYLQRKGLQSEQGVAGVKALKALYDTGRLPRPGPNAAAALRPWLRHPALEADAERLAALLSVSAPKRRHPARRLPLLEEVERIRSARIYTSQGEIRVSLAAEEAPYTVYNFARLAEDGWYDGLSFHRVVADFVIQVGCPRGDGWGGPGYEIPDEINELAYGRGVLGMALSGPDTGGSQWFITLAPQPHLEGTYTVFGEVTYGMRSALEIHVGDTIEHIEIERVP